MADDPALPDARPGASREDARSRTGPASWAAWWDGPTDLDLEGWRRDTEAFARAALPILELTASDDLLDLGCGPGFALATFAPRVRSAVGADAAPRLLDLARARAHASDDPAVRGVAWVGLRADAPGDLAPLGVRRFTVVVVHSVLQYLPDLDAVDALLAAVRGVVVPGARVLLSDLPTGTGRLADAWGLVRGAARQGRLREALGRLVRLRGSSYARARARLGLLVPDVGRLRATVAALGGRLEEGPTALSILAHRRHVMARF